GRKHSIGKDETGNRLNEGTRVAQRGPRSGVASQPRSNVGQELRVGGKAFFTQPIARPGAVPRHDEAVDDGEDLVPAGLLVGPVADVGEMALHLPRRHYERDVDLLVIHRSSWTGARNDKLFLRRS